MIPEKKFLRKMTVAAILLLLLLALVFACGVPFFFAHAQDEGGTFVTGSMNRDGKLSLSVTVDKGELEPQLKEKDAFKGYVDRIVALINTSSKDDDVVRLQSVKEKGNTFVVSVKTRRLNGNISGMGDFEWDKVNRFTAPESDTYTRLLLMNNGSLKCTLSRAYDPLIGRIEITKSTSNRVYIKPVDAKSGKELSVEEFSERGVKESDKTHISMFRFPDTKSIKKITIELPGKVKYYSTGCVKLIGDGKVELTPVTLSADVTRREYVLDENGDRICDSSGVYRTKTTVSTDEKIGCIFGYVVYEDGVNVALVCCLSVLGAAIAALIVVGIIKGWFRKFFGLPAKNKKVPCNANATAEQSNSSASMQSEKTTEGAAEASAEAAAAPPAAEPVRAKVNRMPNCMYRRIVKHKLLYAMLLPSVILAIMFCYVPMFGVIIAFKDYNLLEGFVGSEWVGAKYFISILTCKDRAVFLVFRNTIYISLIRIATNFPAILIFALMVNEIKSQRMKNLTRTISYLPNFISWIAVGGMMVALFSVDEGMLNKVLVSLFGEDSKVNWYADNRYWWGILAISSMWKSLGWGTIIYMSALGCINTELYDACRIDGGGRFRMIFSVTIPGIMNVIMLQLIMDAGNLVRDNYEQILAMTQGSNSLFDSTYVVGAMSYNAILSGSGYSSATAFGLLQGIIGLALVLLTNRIAKKTDNEGII